MCASLDPTRLRLAELPGLPRSLFPLPEGEEKEQEIESLFEQIMKENFPNLEKEIEFQEVQEIQRVPKKLDPRRHTPRHIIIKLSKIKGKEGILKAARAKETFTYKRKSHKTISWFLKRNLKSKKRLERSTQSYERQGPTSKLLYPAKLSFRMEGQIKCFPDKVKLKDLINTKPLLYDLLKELIQEKEEDKK